jgi:hypothetical protein
MKLSTESCPSSSPSPRSSLVVLWTRPGGLVVNYTIYLVKLLIKIFPDTYTGLAYAMPVVLRQLFGTNPRFTIHHAATYLYS